MIDDDLVLTLIPGFQTPNPKHIRKSRRKS